MITRPSVGYELLDSGGEEKLERFGNVILRRPDPQALWEKGSNHEVWGKAEGTFVREGGEGKWTLKSSVPKEWLIKLDGLSFLIRPTSFKHTGVFPEQLSNWEWTKETIHNAGREVSVLNLFGYTGGATLAAAQAGASVTHVDASKTAVAWARENAAASGLADKPIRWITEDVLVFVKREIKRGTKYDAIIMDPPAFGHGPGGELWKIEDDLLPLIELCSHLLSDKPLFIVMNGYAAGYSPLAFAYNLEPFTRKLGGEIEYGDLMIQEAKGERSLPCGIFARWRAS
ncbi:MAG TPA: class I SAM-dependent methyltransferase [Candidatus Paceibacterota bacterium]|nr:class I SAM-dependent methyltransferase [Candidatus Paceibacterota bacterium]